MGNAKRKMETVKLLVSVFIFTLVVLGSTFAHAVLTKQLSYQGRLLDASGVPVPNGTYTVVFSIYNVSTGGSPLWTETQNVAVDKGGFSVYLGSVAPLAVPFNEDYFLGIKVGADPEMTPRLKLAVVGTSAFALDAGNFGGQPPSNYAPASHSHSFGSLTGAVAVSPSANQTIQPSTASVTPLGIKGQTGQSVPYFTVEDNAGGRLFAIMPDGHVLIPSPNVLHVAKMDNDSPAGPMGDIGINAINPSGDSKVVIVNSDPAFKASLDVEGKVFVGNPSVQAAALSVLGSSVSDYAARFEINNASNNVPLIFGNHQGTGELIALEKSGTTQFAVNNAGDVFLKGNITKTAPAMTIDVRDAGNSVLNITNTSAGTASLQVEGATVVTSVNGIVANPSATQTITAQNAGTTALSVKSAASPTAPIFEVLDNASVRKLAVMSDGHVFIPGNNQLHVLNINNDSPTGPMGNMILDVMNSTGNSKLILQNPDASFKADLDIEGSILFGSANPVISATGVAANITLDANDAAASTVTITNSGTGVAKLSVEGGIDFGGGNIVNSSGLGTISFDIPGGTNKTFNVTNSLGGVTDLQVEGKILAFNGTNSVPVTGAAAQQLIQSGFVSPISCPAGATVTFPTAYTGIPIVVIVPTGGASSLNFSVGSTTSTNFTVSCNPGGSLNINWIAIGDK